MSNFAKILDEQQYAHFSRQLNSSTFSVALIRLTKALIAVEDEMVRTPNRDHAVLQDIITPLRGTLERLAMNSDASTTTDEQAAYVLRKFIQRDFDELYERAQKVDSRQIMVMSYQ